MSYTTLNGWTGMDERTIDFARLVRELRAAEAVTQERLARDLGVSYGTVNGWENGKHRPLRVLARRLLRRASRAGVMPQALSASHEGA